MHKISNRSSKLCTSMEWAIYVMTFIDVMKQNGVGSGGLCTENVWGV